MEDIMRKVIEFRDARGWASYHTEKDLAISISLEANELLENFQWKDSAKAVSEAEQNIKEEMADVFIYLLQLADKMQIDLKEEAFNKMEKNEKKYPLKKIENNS